MLVVSLLETELIFAFYANNKVELDFQEFIS